jgi:hypothetical protein
MSVVPHGSDQTESQPIAPSRRRVKDATSAIARTKDATANALVEAWSKMVGRKPKANHEASKARTAERIARLADKTKARTTTAVAASKVGLARAVEIGRENVLPELERTGAILKERTRPERLRHDYREYLIKLHAQVLDRHTESLFFVPTKDHVPLKGLTIRGDNRQYGHDYRPSPCSLFAWTLASIDYDLSRLTFVDYGAGKGRVLLLAAEHPFAAIGGMEFAEELHDNAIMNLAQFPRSRMKCRNVECVLDDASALGPPEGESVHYFFNPFAREVFAEVLHNLVVSYRKRPRRLYLILIDPVATDLVDDSGVFTRLDLPLPERIKVKLFSPYEIALYRSLA